MGCDLFFFLDFLNLIQLEALPFLSKVFFKLNLCDLAYLYR